MPQIHTIKPTFAGGELAPSMYSRVDLAKYATGAKTLKNIIVHPHGGASNLPGTYHVSTGRDSGIYLRLHEFIFSTTQAYVIEFGNYYIRFYTQEGQIIKSSASGWITTHAYSVGDYVTQSGAIYYCEIAHTSGTFATDLAAGKWTAQNAYQIPSPYPTSVLSSLNFTQSNDVLFIFCGSYQTRQLNRFGDANWTLTLYDFQYGPFQIANSNTSLTMTPSGVTGSITLTASSSYFDSAMVGGLFQLNHQVPEQSTTAALASVTASSSISCGGTWRVITHGTWTGTIVIQKSSDNGSTWTNLRTFSSSNDFNANTYGEEDMSDNAPAFLVRVSMTAYTSGTCNITLTSDQYRNVGVVKLTAYTSATQVTATVTKTLGLASATSDWSEGSWSNYRGWPSTGEFCQDRLVTGNTKTQPQTTWMTKTSNYYDYSVNDPLVDSDSISVNLPTRQLNGINSFVSLTSLLALTSSSEWAIGAPDTVLSPSTISQKPNGYTGSNGIKPVVIKNRAVFVQAMGGLLQDLGYDLYSNSFVGADLSILANHLFAGYTIVDMAYQQYPDSIVWCVRSDGELLSMTYLREQEVLAWTHNNINGKVESICVIPYNGYNQLWLSVNRDGVRYIEYMVQRLKSFDPEDQHFVFSGIVYSGSPTTTVSGLDHLEGKEVAVLADGNVVANYLNPITVTSGQITLPFSASKVIVGLPYYSDIETLNIEEKLPDGTMQGRKVRVGKLVLRVVNSRGGYIGPDANRLKELRDNDRTVYDDALTLKTGDLKQTLGGGYTDGGRVYIRQYDPLPLTVSAIIPVVTPAGMTGE